MRKEEVRSQKSEREKEKRKKKFRRKKSENGGRKTEKMNLDLSGNIELKKIKGTDYSPIILTSTLLRRLPSNSP